MSSELRKAEQTALDAARATARLINFANAVLRELATAVATHNRFRMLRTDPVRVSTGEQPLLLRYARAKTAGDLLPLRYLFAPFVAPHAKLQAAGSERVQPFVLASLINSEERPPSVVYGFLRDTEGRERHEEIFLEHFVLWLNETLGEAKAKASTFRDSYVVDQVLAARYGSHTVSARIIFREMPLLDINAENLPPRCQQLAEWFDEILPASREIPRPR